LLTGIAPIAAAAIGVPVTGAMPGAAVWAGVAVIAVGLAVGLPAGSGATLKRLRDRPIRRADVSVSTV
jgi:hypothetical protein